MIKLYEGVGINKIHFISTNREVELHDDELLELGFDFDELDDKLADYKRLVIILQNENQELRNAHHKLQRGLL